MTDEEKVAAVTRTLAGEFQPGDRVKLTIPPYTYRYVLAPTIGGLYWLTSNDDPHGPPSAIRWPAAGVRLA